jgi:hypothetical protein
MFGLVNMQLETWSLTRLIAYARSPRKSNPVVHLLMSSTPASTQRKLTNCCRRWRRRIARISFLTRRRAGSLFLLRDVSPCRSHPVLCTDSAQESPVARLRGPTPSFVIATDRPALTASATTRVAVVRLRLTEVAVTPSVSWPTMAAWWAGRPRCGCFSGGVACVARGFTPEGRRQPPQDRRLQVADNVTKRY